MSALTMLAESAAGIARDDQSFTMPQIVMLATLVSGMIALLGGITALWMNARKVRRENEADAQARTDRIIEQMRKSDSEISDRLSRLDARCQDFMPKTEIIGAIEHLKTNRQGVEAGLDRRIEAAERGLVELRVAVGVLDQQQKTVAGEVSEIKSLVKEQGRDTAARFDKLQDSVTRLSASRA